MLGKGLTYLRTQWPKLIRFTTTPHALRYLTLGNVVRGSHTFVLMKSGGYFSDPTFDAGFTALCPIHRPASVSAIGQR
ncbi:MAG: unnamed protein product [uncultured Paraburkholderia sp.]|nr:MAG: unnamed protein product [uncultured Paraburkholderia sp.]